MPAVYFWIIVLIAFGLALALTPVSIKIAKKCNILDVPRDNRRMHKSPVPRIGGTAMFVAVTCAVLVALRLGLLDSVFRDGEMIIDPTRHMKIYGILLGGLLMHIVGLIDDIRGMKPVVKLGGQIAAALVIFAFGVRINFIGNIFGSGIQEFGMVISLIATVIWVVGITNCVNLIDGLDGLAGGIVAISAFCIAYVAYIFGMYAACFPMLAIAGSCVGFLPFNFYPAKTFMGDGGSQYLGCMLAAFSILGPVKGATVVAVIIPVLCLALPILDTLFAIIRRWVNRRPIMEADKGHIHHRLMRAGMGQRRTVLCMYGICGIMGIAAILFSRSLYKETFGLFAIAFMYMYVVLTDIHRITPKFKEESEKPNSDEKAE